MFRSLAAAALTATLAAALAFSPVAATPAQAQDNSNQQLARILAGAATVAIIGLAINREKQRERNAAAVPVHDWRRPVPPVYQQPRYRLPRHDKPRYEHHDRHDWRDRDQRTVPASCLRTIYNRHGAQTLFGARCISRSMRHPNRLPQQCAQTLRSDRGWVTGFEPGCLQRYGWRRG
ncbi:hypothetical protein [Oceaniglobus roseus]|uniref:hypothetical protein n=1 Tax=Oceaniglobus roseus TaxID=1737570 RepID=UPI000C7EE1CF|nr:hypothetical protein [Kandeliimicrobium roseum]